MDAAVFDTNILIDFSYSRPGAQEIIRRCSNRYISAVTWVEFLTGIPAPQMKQAQEFLQDMFDVLYPAEETYAVALQVRRERRLKFPDAMIYAAAKEISVPLITRNTKDFDETAPDIHVPYK